MLFPLTKVELQLLPTLHFDKQYMYSVFSLTSPIPVGVTKEDASQKNMERIIISVYSNQHSPEL